MTRRWIPRAVALGLVVAFVVLVWVGSALFDEDGRRSDAVVAIVAGLLALAGAAAIEYLATRR